MQLRQFAKLAVKFNQAEKIQSTRQGQVVEKVQDNVLVARMPLQNNRKRSICTEPLGTVLARRKFRYLRTRSLEWDQLDL